MLEHAFMFHGRNRRESFSFTIIFIGVISSLTQFAPFFSFPRFRVLFEMNYCFITIFTLLIIFAQFESATVTPRKSDVLWVTEELQTPPVEVQVRPLEDAAKKLMRILNDMRDLVERMPADDPGTEGQYQYPGVPCGSGKDQEQSKADYLNYYTKTLEMFIKSSGKDPPSKPKQTEILNNITKKIIERQELPAFRYRPIMLSLYPICNNSLMTDGFPNTTNAINVVFDLSYPPSSPEKFINVTSAVLRIYKTKFKGKLNPSHYPPTKNITFSAVYFKNPTHHKNQNKSGFKLDEQILRINEERWTQWDVRKAVAAWYNDTRNYGVTIKVADDQVPLPAREFFNIPINCSNITEYPALPPELSRNGSLNGISVDVPFLDLTIEEVSYKDMKFVEKERLFSQGINELKHEVNSVTDSTHSTGHKFRHQKNKNSSKEKE